MTGLVIKLNPGDTLLINGAEMRADRRVELILTTRARFVFGRQFMAAQDATTPERRFYRAVQTAYAGAEGELQTALAEAKALAAEVNGGAVVALLEADDGYGAQRAAQAIVQRADAEGQGRRASANAAGASE